MWEGLFGHDGLMPRSTGMCESGQTRLPFRNLARLGVDLQQFIGHAPNLTCHAPMEDRLCCHHAFDVLACLIEGNIFDPDTRVLIARHRQPAIDAMGAGVIRGRGKHTVAAIRLDICPR